MMTNKEVYRIWAPTGKKWTEWVRPVPFVTMRIDTKRYYVSNTALTTTMFEENKFSNAAIIVDLPGVQSVEMGIVLAKLGYRPIPIFNGTIEQEGARATVDNQSIGNVLAWGALELCKIEISDEALPAFLTDSNRLHRFKMEESLFDNSWDVYPQDLHSADYFLSNGIRKIVVVGETVSKDLKKILFEFQKKKIKIFLTQGYETPKEVRIYRPIQRKHE